MSNQDIQIRIRGIEMLATNLQQEAYNLRMKLERINAPAPTGVKKSGKVLSIEDIAKLRNKVRRAAK